MVNTPHSASAANRRAPVLVSRKTTPGTITAETAVALTPPAQATASAATAHQRTRSFVVVVPLARMTASSTQGATAVGHSSAELAPRMVITRGVRTYAAAPATCAHGLPSCSSRATIRTPRNARLSNSAHHSRWITHSGSWASWPRP